MSQARKLAAALGVKTADQVEPPEPAAEPVRGQVLRWTQRRRDIFNFLGPVNISLVATDGPVSVTVWDPGGHGVRTRLGHNRAVWPARIVNGSSRRDAATTTWNKFPGVFLGTQARLWTLREADRDKLALAIVDLITERAGRDGGLERLDHGFQDLGPELDLAMFELEMLDVAHRLGNHAVWDDEGLMRWFDSIGARFDAMRAQRPEIRWSETLIVKIAMKDIEAAKEGRR